MKGWVRFVGFVNKEVVVARDSLRVNNGFVHDSVYPHPARHFLFESRSATASCMSYLTHGTTLFSVVHTDELTPEKVVNVYLISPVETLPLCPSTTFTTSLPLLFSLHLPFFHKKKRKKGESPTPPSKSHQ